MIVRKLSICILLLCAGSGCGGGTSGTASGDTKVRAILSSTSSQAADITIQSLSSSKLIAVGSSGEILASRIDGVIPLIVTRKCSNCAAGELKDVFNLDGVGSSVSLISLGIILNGDDTPTIEIVGVQ